MAMEPTHGVTFDAAALTTDQCDGVACVVCSSTTAVMRPVGILDGAQVFACSTHIAPCSDCNTVEYRYIDLDNDTARMDCPAGHAFPTAQPMTPEGAAADAELRERTARRATWPDGEPASVRDAADNEQGADGAALAAQMIPQMDRCAGLARDFADDGETDLADAFAAIAEAWRKVADVFADDELIVQALDELDAATERGRVVLAAARARATDAQGTRS